MASSSSHRSPDAWLSALVDHPIFTLPAEVTTTPEASTSASSSTFKRAIMVVRGGDLLVAVDREIRICSLGEAKSGGKTAYKTLRTPIVDFPILQLVPNPTGKLLAIVGSHQLAVIVLPRPGYVNLVSPLLDCRSVMISPYHHAPSNSPLSKVLWHPLSTQSTSLLVLTLDGLLREYDPLTDAEEPQQQLSLLPPRMGGRGYGVDEPGEREAVSFCLGRGEGDWGWLSVYGLMANGDVYGVCPFLPKNASIPQSYVQALAAFTSSKVSYLSTFPIPLGGAPSLSSSASLSSPSSSSKIAATPASTLSTRYLAQQSYLDSLLRQISKHFAAHPTEMRVDDSAEPILLHPPPNTAGRKPCVQGPFLMQPAPRELDGGRATDLVFISGAALSDQQQPQEAEADTSTPEGENSGAHEGMAVLGVVFDDGKVDLLLEVEKMEALWVGSSESTRSNPTLAVYETIDLGLSASVSPISPVDPSFFIDPLYEDSIYVFHSQGVHCLLLQRWLGALGEALRVKDDTARAVELDRFFGRGLQTEVVAVVDTVSDEDSTSASIHGLTLISDVYLSYSLLALTSSLQLVALPQSLRIFSPPSPKLAPISLSSNTTTSATSKSSSSSAYISLLSQTPFTIPPLLANRSGLPSQPYHQAPGTSAPLTEITPALLRTLGKSVESLRADIRETIRAGSTVQGRLDLQIKELERQLDKLADVTELVRGIQGEKGLGARVERVLDVQGELIGRMDKVLQRLMDRHQPVLSEHERKWFEELGRLEKDVTGGAGGGSEDRGLALRTQTVENHLKVLRPKLEEIARRTREQEALKKADQKPAGLGKLQLAKLEQQLAVESKLLASVTAKLDKLSVEVESLRS